VGCLEEHLEYSKFDGDGAQFARVTFRESIRTMPGMTSEIRAAYDRAFARVLRDPTARAEVVTPRGYPDQKFGWAVSLPSCLVFAYVRYEARRGRLGHHFGMPLIRRVWSDLGNVIPICIWTHAASRMSKRGVPLRYDLDEHEKFLQLAR
jgi:hypothetical protein